MVCFLHVHRRVLQSVRQMRLIIRSSFSGAGASAVCSGKKPSLHSCRAHSVGRRSSADILHSWTGRAGSPAYYDILLLLVLVVGSVDER